MNISRAMTGPMPPRAGPTRIWFWGVAGLGTLWNAYGALQFAYAVTATRDSLIAMGMTGAQADVMSSYPLWMTIAFAIGTTCGLAGSVLLLMKQRLAVPLFTASLAGYVALYIGDITEGVFAALGAPQIFILSLVVAIACGLLWASRRAARNGILA